MTTNHSVRRILTPVVLAVMLVLMVSAAFAFAVFGLAGTLVDRRARVLRVAILLGLYAGLELLVPLLLLATWLLRLVRIADENADRKAVGWALGILLGTARAVCGFQVTVEEPTRLWPFDGEDPVLVLARHGGIGDSFALVHLLISRYGRRPRVVLKRSLLWDPLVDVALTRMGACWIGPSSVGSSRAAIAHLAADVAPGEAVLLFPEGGNWTPRRRILAMARFWKSGRLDELKTASLMEHVLPPKSGGVLACLDARPDMPVVVMAHVGLDKITSARSLWRAIPFTTPMQVRWWTAAPAPCGEADRVSWLTTEWAVVDQWIAAAGPSAPR